MFRRLSNLLLPAFLALLTALPAAGMVLRPCAEGALPVQAFANLSDALPSSFSLQPSDFSLHNSAFSPANSQNCANDPVNLTDSDGRFVQFIVLGVLAGMDCYAAYKADEAIHNAQTGGEILTIADREYQVGLLKSGAVGGVGAAAIVTGGAAVSLGFGEAGVGIYGALLTGAGTGYGSYSAVENVKNGNYVSAGLDVVGIGFTAYGGVRGLRGAVAEGPAGEWSLGGSPSEFSTPYRQLSKARISILKSKVESRTITREEWNRLQWSRRLGARRDAGVAEFWQEEQGRLMQGIPGTRTWTPKQRFTILAGKRPVGIAGHHTYSVSRYPQLANRGEFIYPVTKNEHLFRWHGGSMRSANHGVPLRPDIGEEF